ncbi:DUF6119 family protein [Nocardia terpenica]|uniref:DUF6119 family protein n=1 Tax=Nocardia terpenica TaxID=455432 RepID=UPI0009EE5DBE|nr:DUF6119 family protein [Nocardia terpenica]NQE90275.1 TIGR04141 family sporadically distributed protein [Nocardia terpenica]
MKAPKAGTRWSSLHRLTDPAGTPIDLRNFIREKYLDDNNYEIREFSHDGLAGLLVSGAKPPERAEWCPAAEGLTGLPVSVTTSQTGGLLLTRTTGRLYALTYGSLGHHILDPAYRDDDFGLGFAVRCLDETDVTRFRNEIMDRRGRVEDYTVLGGSDIAGFGLDKFSALVRRICGGAHLNLTAKSHTSRTVRVECSGHAIKLPLATTPAQFLADLAEIERVCDKEDPLDGLAFVHRFRKLNKNSPAALAADEVLAKLLGDPSNARLGITLPDNCVGYYGAARSFRITLGGSATVFGEIDLAVLLERIRDRDEHRRLQDLHRLRITMYQDAGQTMLIGPETRGTDWLVAEVESDDERYYYGQGSWHEIGAWYLETLREELDELLSATTEVTVPAWPKGKRRTSGPKKGQDSHDEDWFNRKLAEQASYQLFDKKNSVTGFYRGGGLEICDVLGPDCELICVKKATSSAPLSHLFAQAINAVTALRNDRDVAKKFRDRIARHNPDHPMVRDIGTLKVVFAILLNDGEEITTDSLFPFSQISLVRSLIELRTMNAEVRVVAIRRS